MKINLGTSRRARGGFTLVELLVVIGIIVLLFSIATPIVITARRNAARVRMQADLNTIATGLEQYKKDFRDYPRPVIDPANPATARQAVLAWALVGPWQAAPDGTNPGDGADGNGFRLQWDNTNKTGGRVWGPYVPPDKFPVEIVSAADAGTPFPAAYLLDSYGSRIEYFPLWHKYKPNMPLFGVNAGNPLTSDVANGSGFGIYDCRQASSNPNAKEAVYYLQRAMGDGSDGASNYQHDDFIKPPETPLTTDFPPFILFSHGYQGKGYSPQDEVDKNYTKVPEVSTLPQP
jgi:prepilin-type N-terminal cleavage/methylation domain-containing protein